VSVSKELLEALAVTERAELFLELDAETGLQFFLWAEKHHPEMIESLPAWDVVRRYVLKTGEIPVGIAVREVPNAAHDSYYLEQTEPTKEEASGTSE